MDYKRRSFLTSLIQATAAATAAGSIVAGFVEENKDKPLKFRYLRTVIVTAVYRGFGSLLRIANRSP